MTDLRPISALGAWTPLQKQIGPFELSEASDIALASCVLNAGDQQTPFGLSLPGPGGMSSSGDQDFAIWLSPDQWIIGRRGAAESDFASLVAAEVPDARVTEQTDAWVVLRASANASSDIEALLERLVNVSPATRAPGKATRTLLHHMSVFILRPTLTEVMLMGMRSQAESLMHAVQTAAAQRAL